MNTETLFSAARAAWPAAVCERVGGYMFLASHEHSNRANHVYPLEQEARVAPVLDAAATFFKRHERPLQFQVAEVRSAMDAELASLGFGLENPSLILIRDRDGGPSLELPPEDGGFELHVDSSLSPAWLDAWATCAGIPAEERTGCFEVVRRVAGSSLYAVIRDRDGRPISVGRAVDSADCRGIHNLATLGTHQGRGFATRVMSELHARGRTRPEIIYLQVDGDNTARALYERLGYRQAVRYHYRRAEHR